MPKISKSITTTMRLHRWHYWCLEYLNSVGIGDTKNDLIQEAMRYAIKYINETDGDPRKPREVSVKDSLSLTVVIDREIETAMSLVKINKQLHGWNRIHFVRYGLNATMLSYARRFPDMNKIIERFKLNEDQ